MRAFVLSGGANYGALQSGAPTALLEHGIHPDLRMGVSAGALNAAWPTVLHASSAPSPADFWQVFEHLSRRAEPILAITVSGQLSIVYESALPPVI